MWIVRLALKKPYTFVVMSLLIAILGAGAVLTTPTDIFPRVDIPVISVVWLYRGLPTPDMEKQLTTFSEYAISFGASNVKNIESQTLSGISVIKIYFHENVNIAAAMAEVAASAEFWLDKPVIAINTATYWYALRDYGIKDKAYGWGSLLSEH